MTELKHSIKIDSPVYVDLYAFLEKGETFSQGIARLLRIYEGLANLRGIIGGVKSYGEYLDKEATPKEKKKQILGLAINTGDDESP